MFVKKFHISTLLKIESTIMKFTKKNVGWGPGSPFMYRFVTLLELLKTSQQNTLKVNLKPILDEVINAVFNHIYYSKLA